MKSVTLPKIFMPFYCENIVRLGKNNDGGYLVNGSDVMKSNNLLSFGIGEDVSFEQDFIEQNKWCNVLAYDETIQNEHSEFFTDRKKLFHKNITPSNIDDILEENGDAIFLKCDIDGGEYDILHDLIKHSHRFTGIAIEFHNMSNYQNFNEITNFIAKIELRLIHVHINNYAYIIRQDGTYTPDVVELTFSSSKDNTELKRNAPLPHPLDMTNNPNDDEFRISF